MLFAATLPAVVNTPPTTSSGLAGPAPSLSQTFMTSTVPFVPGIPGPELHCVVHCELAKLAKKSHAPSAAQTLRGQPSGDEGVGMRLDVSLGMSKVWQNPFRPTRGVCVQRVGDRTAGWQRVNDPSLAGAAHKINPHSQVVLVAQLCSPRCEIDE